MLTTFAKTSAWDMQDMQGCRERLGRTLVIVAFPIYLQIDMADHSVPGHGYDWYLDIQSPVFGRYELVAQAATYPMRS